MMLRPSDHSGHSGHSEAGRLEGLWGGEFGDAYIERNERAGENRGSFWRATLQEFPCRRALEVGCNIGANLRWISTGDRVIQAYGVDVNQKALVKLQATYPKVITLRANARELPFRDGFFDLVFTMGVLIHQPAITLPLVMGEIVRCSRRFVLCGEYYAPDEVEVPYRGQTGALFKRDYGRLYQDLFPDLTLQKHGFLGRDEGWDDMTYWMFEKMA
ncbi:MAG: pseudaminic acid biosynthesis-associated methylase [Chloroflexota bacterium]